MAAHFVCLLKPSQWPRTVTNRTTLPFFKDLGPPPPPFKIRSDIQGSDILKEMNQAWKWRNSVNDVKFLDNDVSIITDPFPACVVKNFIGEKVLFVRSARCPNDNPPNYKGYLLIRQWRDRDTIHLIK
jgi:hypothetical protein